MIIHPDIAISNLYTSTPKVDGVNELSIFVAILLFCMNQRSSPQSALAGDLLFCAYSSLWCIAVNLYTRM